MLTRLSLALCAALTLPSAASAQSWEGPYAGTFVSVGEGTLAGYIDDFFTPSIRDFYDGTATGGHVGGFAGMNWDLGGPMIVGIEVMAQIGGVSGSATDPRLGQVTTLTYGSRASLAARLGFDAGPVLPFFSLGLAMSEIQATIAAGGEAPRDTLQRSGRILGLGADVAMSEQSFLRVELRHMTLDDINYPATDVPGDTAVGPQRVVDPSATEILIGIGFRF